MQEEENDKEDEEEMMKINRNIRFIIAFYNYYKSYLSSVIDCFY